MRLAEWLEHSNTTQSALAQEAGTWESTISRFLSGERGLTPEVARRIVECTKGKVSLEELLFPDEFKSGTNG